jgi:uncharacterized lipoprotein YddW (UPF0748 family)
MLAAAGVLLIQAPAMASAPTPTTEPAEVRAVWVDAFHAGIKTREQVDKLIADALRANLNTLIVQVRKRGDAYFSRSREPRANDPDLAPEPYDPLDYVVAQAHAAGLEVHAWLNIFNVGTSSRVWREHATDWGSRRPGGNPAGGYLDPGHPDAAAYTQQVLLNLVRDYDVDGIHMDYVRYPEGGDWGYNPTSVARFDLAYGREGVPAPSDPEWSQWRRDQVTSFVRDFYGNATELKPALKVSAALIAFGAGPTTDQEWQRSRTYGEVYQDWKGWLEEGILDLGAVMNYDREWNPTQRLWFNAWIEWEKNHQGSRAILAGVGAFFNYPEDTHAQIRRARLPSAAGNQLAGVVLFSYASTNPYGNADYYTNPAAAATLPRQPYARDWDRDALAERARQFNFWFWDALSEPSQYLDPALDLVIYTQPVFERPVEIPPLPWK